MKGRGARGEGSYLATCDRVVLDSNTFQGSPRRELEAVHARGFRLSVSIEGLREFWARTLREDNYRKLRARITLLGPLLDEEHPVAFVGTALLSMIGAAPPNVGREAAEFRDRVTGAWRVMRERDVSLTEWSDIGRELQAELDDEDRWWLGVPDELRNIDELERRLAEAGGIPDPKARRWSDLHQRLARGEGVVTEPSLSVRSAAYRHYLIAKIKAGLKKNPEPNDFQDARHLQHVAWPAFLMTEDFDLIRSVQQTCPRQAPWVRTPVELAEDRVARCEPWGKAATRVADEFSRVPFGVRRTRQLAWREKLRGERGTVPPTVPGAVQ